MVRSVDSRVLIDCGDDWLGPHRQPSPGSNPCLTCPDPAGARVDVYIGDGATLVVHSSGGAGAFASATPR